VPINSILDRINSLGFCQNKMLKISGEWGVGRRCHHPLPTARYGSVISFCSGILDIAVFENEPDVLCTCQTAEFFVILLIWKYMFAR